MVNRDADAADVRMPPPLLYVAAIAVGISLHVGVYPLELTLPPIAQIAAAVLTGGVGLTLVLAAVLAFKRSGQNPKPWKTTPEIVASGPYRWSRNPMYTGMALAQASLAFSLSNGWLLALVPAVLFGVYLLAVRHEETYLEGKFGEPYLAFKRSVRRWL